MTSSCDSERQTARLSIQKSDKIYIPYTRCISFIWVSVTTLENILPTKCYLPDVRMTSNEVKPGSLGGPSHARLVAVVVLGAGQEQTSLAEAHTRKLPFPWQERHIKTHCQVRLSSQATEGGKSGFKNVLAVQNIA